MVGHADSALLRAGASHRLGARREAQVKRGDC